MSCRPCYRGTPATKISRLGPKVIDDQTGYIFYSKYAIYQHGLLKDGRNMSSVDVEYGPYYYPPLPEQEFLP